MIKYLLVGRILILIKINFDMILLDYLVAYYLVHFSLSDDLGKESINASKII
jgi:hypothetical protein